MLIPLLIAFLGLAVVGLFALAVHALRRAARTEEQILSDVLGHRGAHERYASELGEWHKSDG
jgi:high-affinity Fe2+/Pb2+ permease